MRLQINRSLDGKFKRLQDIVEGYPEVYANKMATELVLNSPVDSGAFMDGYYVGSSYGGTSTSSKGRPTNQPWEPYANAAISRMSSQVVRLLSSTSMVFGNSAEHAFQVEYDHGYAPFGKAAREHGRIAREAEAEAKAIYG